MITKYFANVVVKMPAKGPAAKHARIFLSSIPPRSRQDVKLSFEMLAPDSTAAPEISVSYKDGTKLSCDPGHVATQEMFELFDRQSRKLQIADSLKE